MDHWPYVLAVSMTAIASLWLWTRTRPSASDRLERDAADPYRQWVQCVFLLVTGDCDYAHLPGAEARRLLAHWWDVYGPLEHRRTLVELSQPADGRDHAWDLVRFVLVSRLGVAAGICDDDESWEEILPIARRLQQAYPGWRAMAWAYVQARRQSLDLPLDGTGDDASMHAILDNLARLDDTRWASTDFRAPLFVAEGPSPRDDEDEDDDSEEGSPRG